MPEADRMTAHATGSSTPSRKPAPSGRRGRGRAGRAAPHWLLPPAAYPNYASYSAAQSGDLGNERCLDGCFACKADLRIASLAIDELLDSTKPAAPDLLEQVVLGVKHAPQGHSPLRRSNRS
jgi:hypothetical protein